MRRHEDNNAAPSRWRLAMAAVVLIGTPVLIMLTSAMRNTAETQHFAVSYFYEHAGGDGARSDREKASGERDDGPATAPPSFQSVDADAGIGISGYVDDSIDGETVPFFMYPDMANISSRILDCLIFGTGIQNEEDVAKTTAWFRGMINSPPAQWLGDMAMFAQLERSPWRTHDPEKAMLFYVPVLYGLLSMRNAHRCAI